MGGGENMVWGESLWGDNDSRAGPLKHLGEAVGRAEGSLGTEVEEASGALLNAPCLTPSLSFTSQRDFLCILGEN